MPPLGSAAASHLTLLAALAGSLLVAAAVENEGAEEADVSEGDDMRSLKCSEGLYPELNSRLWARYEECSEAAAGSNKNNNNKNNNNNNNHHHDSNASSFCLPTRVSDDLARLAGDIADSTLDFMDEHSSGGQWPFAMVECRYGLLSALLAYARPLLHTIRGQWNAQAAFVLAQRSCWPAMGFGDLAPGTDSAWPVTFREILNVVLWGEAWKQFGDEAEYEIPPRLPMPAAMVHRLTPAAPDSQRASRRGAGVPASKARGSKVLRILSTGHHASYPSAIYAMWRALVSKYDFELEDHSFDNRYCSNSGTCSVDVRFAWLGDELRNTLVRTCSGAYLKGFRDIDILADKLFDLVTDGGSSSPAARADVLLCTHVPYSCRLFWPLVLRLGLPLLGFFGGTLE
ncbi:unnamed protein product, partial [Polarella glacialis]